MFALEETEVVYIFAAFRHDEECFRLAETNFAVAVYFNSSIIFIEVPHSTHKHHTNSKAPNVKPRDEVKP